MTAKRHCIHVPTQDRVFWQEHLKMPRHKGQKIHVYMQRALDAEGIPKSTWRDIETAWRARCDTTHDFVKHLLRVGVHNKSKQINKQKWVRKLVKWYNAGAETCSDAPLSSSAEDGSQEDESDEEEEPVVNDLTGEDKTDQVLDKQVDDAQEPARKRKRQGTEFGRAHRYFSIALSRCIVESLCDSMDGSSLTNRAKEKIVSTFCKKFAMANLYQEFVGETGHWHAQLAAFDLNVTCVSGKSQVVADPLSRLLPDDRKSSAADPVSVVNQGDDPRVAASFLGLVTTIQPQGTQLRVFLCANTHAFSVH